MLADCYIVLHLRSFRYLADKFIVLYCKGIADLVKGSFGHYFFNALFRYRW
jgi:hypothetical protein